MAELRFLPGQRLSAIADLQRSRLSFAIALAVPLALAACVAAPVANGVKGHAGKPSSTYTMQRCTKNWAALSAVEQGNIAAVADVPTSRAGTLLCRRTLEALRTGRLSAEDLEKGGGNYARVIEVIQGR